MNKKTLLTLIPVFILCMFCISGIAEGRERDASTDSASTSDIDITRLENKIHNLVNKERTKRGLSVLLKDKRLNNVARKLQQRHG